MGMDITITYIALLFIIFYFFMIRPQQKKHQEHQKMINAIEKGSDVVISNSIHGKVVGFKNDNKVLIIKVDDNTKLNVERAAITGLKNFDKDSK